MSKHVTDFFKKLSDKVITPDDINSCFNELKAKKIRLDTSVENEERLNAWTEVLFF